LPGAQLVQAPIPAQSAQSGSHSLQTVSALPPHAAAWNWPAPHAEQVAQVISTVAEQAAVWN
jgi:hypothetical protein